MQPYQLRDLHITRWASGRPGRTALWARSLAAKVNASEIHSIATQQLIRDRANSLLFLFLLEKEQPEARYLKGGNPQRGSQRR